jgi:hypothetical protein
MSITNSQPNALRALLGSILAAVGLLATPNALAAISCDSTITANVVVFDSPTVFNRLGAQNPNYITYALERDVIAVDPLTRLPTGALPGTNLTAGNVELRPDKRPRPLVVRSVAEACLTVTFTNLLAMTANPNNAIDDNPPPFVGTDANLINNDQVAGRCAGFHASGTELVNVMADDGSMVGANAGANIGNTDEGQDNCGPGLAEPGGTRTYHLYTPHEGAFVIGSYGARLGSEGNAGNLGLGMFGALNVEPKGSRIYRSQVTEEELRLATTGFTSLGQPIINYEATYPDGLPWSDEGKAGLPILNMLHNGELVHSDINAIIVGRPTRSSPTGSSPSASSPRCITTSRPTRRCSRSGTTTRCSATLWPASGTAS